ncbi:MAG: methyl-accepting chemotaxis protein, partial [Anaerolineae bacterium]|nr:methyl-accepting chemotaxis protein [Anaerolineae bacterium]
MSENTLQTTMLNRRAGASIINLTVLATATAAVVPLLLIGLVGQPLAPDTLLVWGVAAFIGGAALGVIVYSLNRRASERTLRLYLNVLEQVAAGDLRPRLDLTRLDTSGEEGLMLAQVGAATNRMLDRLQAVIQEIGGALQRMEGDTRSILEATARQITMANEQDAVVTETTATVNEVRATVTETAER